MADNTSNPLQPKSASDYPQPPPGYECRTDKGRCFTRGGLQSETGLAVVQFHDGSIYRFGPMTEDVWQEEFQGAEQPGCTWNHRWKDKHPTHWEKLKSYPQDLDYEFHAPL